MRGYSSRGPSTPSPLSISSRAPPRLNRSLMPSVVSTSTVQISSSSSRQSNPAEISPSASGLEKRIFAAIGIARFSGTDSSASRTNKGPGKIFEAIESALMPGSNTPKPPTCQIHRWPGCHFLTLSRQSIRIRAILLPASNSAARSTAGLYCECQVAKSVTCRPSACSRRSSISLKVVAGGFSSRQWSPRSMQSRAMS
jgi:hypothetical protein